MEVGEHDVVSDVHRFYPHHILGMVTMEQYTKFYRVDKKIFFHSYIDPIHS